MEVVQVRPILRALQLQCLALASHPPQLRPQLLSRIIGTLLFQVVERMLVPVAGGLHPLFRAGRCFSLEIIQYLTSVGDAEDVCIPPHWKVRHAAMLARLMFSTQERGLRSSIGIGCRSSQGA